MATPTQTGNELEQFLQAFDHESKNTRRMIEALPKDKYDFRPDPHGRSLGELAWHLAEIEAYLTEGVERGAVDFSRKPQNTERPREVAALATGYQRVHDDAVARVKKLQAADLDREIGFPMGAMQTRLLLWSALLNHQIHHRGQLTLMCRLAGGTCPGLYGPNREEMAEMAKAAGQTTRA